MPEGVGVGFGIASTEFSSSLCAEMNIITYVFQAFRLDITCTFYSLRYPSYGIVDDSTRRTAFQNKIA